MAKWWIKRKKEELDNGENKEWRNIGSKNGG